MPNHAKKVLKEDATIKEKEEDITPKLQKKEQGSSIVKKEESFLPAMPINEDTQQREVLREVLPWPDGEVPRTPTAKGLGRVSGGTDNKGNGHIVARLMTTSFPLCCILMELSAQLEVRGILLDLQWERRSFNVLADKLSNGYFDDFDPNLRVEIDLEKIKWIVLTPPLRRAPELFDQIKSLKEQKKSKGGGKSTKRKREGGAEKLRVRQPWNERFVPRQ